MDTQYRRVGSLHLLSLLLFTTHRVRQQMGLDSANRCTSGTTGNRVDFLFRSPDTAGSLNS